MTRPTSQSLSLEPSQVRHRVRHHVMSPCVWRTFVALVPGGWPQRFTSLDGRHWMETIRHGGAAGRSDGTWNEGSQQIAR